MAELSDETVKKLIKALEANDDNISRKATRQSRESDFKSEKSILDSTKNMTDTVNKAFKTGLTRFIEDSVNRYGGLVDYSASSIENRASITIKRQAEALTELALDTEKFIGDKSIQMVFGSAEAARAELQQIYEENTYYLNKMSKDYKDSDTAGVEVMANAMLIQRALRINVDDFQKIMSIQMASSKQMTADAFEDIAFYADQYADRTSASVYQITNQLTKAMADFSTFGNASNENLGKLAGYLGELRLDTEDITGVVQSIQSFQGAISLTRDLAGITGAVVDPLKLMGNALKDPAEGLNMVREAILDAGITSESSAIELSLLADATHMSIESLRKLLNVETDANSVLENSVKQTEKISTSASDAVSKYNDAIVDNRTVADNIADMVETQSEVMFNSAFKSITDFKTVLSQFITSKGDLFKALNFSDEQIEDFGKALNIYTTSLDEADRKKAKDELEKQLKTITNSQNVADTVKKQADDLLARLEKIESEGGISEFAKFLEDQKTIKYDINVDPEGVEAAYKRLSNSDEIKKYIEVSNKPYQHTAVIDGKPSEFQTSMDMNMQSLEKHTQPGAPLQMLNEQLDRVSQRREVDIDTSKARQDINELITKTGKLDMTLNQKNDKAVIEAIERLTSAVQESSKIANINTKNSYQVIMGTEYETKVKEIATNTVIEYLNEKRTGGSN